MWLIDPPTSQQPIEQDTFQMYVLKNVSTMVVSQKLNMSDVSNESFLPHNRVNESLTDVTLAMAIIRYVFPVIIVVGTLGNVASMLVLRRKSMQRNCSSMYLIMLAVADTVVLYLSCFKTWLRMVTNGFEILHVNNGICKTVKYLFFTSTHFSAWLVVLLTCERFLAVCFPFRASRIWIVQRPWMTILMAITTIMMININYFWTSQLINEGDKLKCVVYEQNTTMCTVFPILNMLTYSLLPAIIVFSFNTAIIITIVRHCYDEEPLQQQNALLKLRRQNQRRLTLMLLTISILWLLLTGPYAIIDSSFVHNNNVLLRTVAYSFMYVNHAINFYIYCLTGKKFRHELKRMFGYQVYSSTRETRLQNGKALLPLRDTVGKLSRRQFPIKQLYE